MSSRGSALVADQTMGAFGKKASPSRRMESANAAELGAQLDELAEELSVPTGPGLGVEVDEGRLREM